MTIPQWSPGTLHNPGDVVVPRSTDIVTQEQPHNNSFEDGLTHWTTTIDSGGSGTMEAATDESFDGSTSGKFHNGVGPELRSSALCELVNDFMGDLEPTDETELVLIGTLYVTVIDGELGPGSSVSLKS